MFFLQVSCGCRVWSCNAACVFACTFKRCSMRAADAHTKKARAPFVKKHTTTDLPAPLGPTTHTKLLSNGPISTLPPNALKSVVCVLHDGGGRMVVEQQQEKRCARRSYSTPSKSPHTQHHAVSFIHTLTLLTLDLDLVYINGPMLLLITALVVVICHLCCF